jgi:hypothetical protein
MRTVQEPPPIPEECSVTIVPAKIKIQEAVVPVINPNHLFNRQQRSWKNISVLRVSNSAASAIEFKT